MDRILLCKIVEQSHFKSFEKSACQLLHLGFSRWLSIVYHASGVHRF